MPDWKAILDMYGLRTSRFATTNVPDSISYLDELSFEASDTKYINSPSIPESYIPLVQFGGHDGVAVAELFRQGALMFVHEIWTQLLVTHRDKREKQIYMLWDEEIPKPNLVTALFWLMVCESWPMIRVPDNFSASVRTIQDLFPFQSFVLPSSGHRLYATQYPPEFVAATHGLPSASLDDMLNLHMTREDRERMRDVSFSTRVHRPQGLPYTHYWAHTATSHDSRWPRMWADDEGWPSVPVMRFDGGVAVSELRSSWWHLKHLQSLRQNVMRHLRTGIGIPTCYDALYTCPGGWLRQWSESCFMVDRDKEAEPHHWTPDRNTVTLEGGAILNDVPSLTPRIWFGWTHIGPKYATVDNLPVREESASESWARAYMNVRPTAIQMLFHPHESHITRAMLDDYEVKLAARLQRAGRVTKTRAGSKANVAFIEAFRNLIPNKDS